MPPSSSPRSDDPAWEAALAAFLKSQGLPTKDLGLFRQAFLHRSFLNETQAGSSNERLEFLGDAVLGLAASKALCRLHPDWDEGRLAQAKSVLVSEAALARWARELGLGKLLRLGKGEARTGGADKPALLADCLEALAGALFLDQGLAAVEAFSAPRWEMAVTDEDPKSRLQEWAQKMRKKVPQYRLSAALGPDHARDFEVEVLLEGRVLAKGKGKSKKAAEQEAARKALEST